MKTQEERQPGFGVDGNFLTALSDLVNDDGGLWGLENRDGIYVLVKGKETSRNGFTSVEIVREVEVPKAFDYVLKRLVYNEGRRVRNQIRDALGLERER